MTVVSWSEIASYRQCPHKHDLEYLQRWRSPSASPALARGTAWHSVMEAHYGEGAVSEALASIDDDDERDLIRWMYEGYVEFFGQDDEWSIVAVEFPLVVPLGPGFELKCKLDLIVKWKKKLWVVDHKSCKDLPSDKMLDLDDQFGLYTWALQQMGKKVFGSLHNAARTQRNKSKPQLLEDRFRRTPMYRTDSELETIAKEAYASVRDAHRERTEPAERHTDPDRCRWKCSFTEGCLHGRKTTDSQEIDFLTSAGYVQDFTRH